MERVGRLLAGVLVTGLLVQTTPASAFVPPRWNAARESRRSLLVGTWSAVSFKSKSGPKLEAPGLLIRITPTTMTVDGGGKLEEARWRLVRQEAELLVLEVVERDGKTTAVDVLVEGSDALTMYLQDDEGDDDASIRLERVHP